MEYEGVVGACVNRICEVGEGEEFTASKAGGGKEGRWGGGGEGCEGEGGAFLEEGSG